MTEGPVGALRAKLLQRTAIITAAAVVVVLAGGFLAWSATCPCERTPGAWLFGMEHDEAVSDWRFANQVTLCQIQIRTGLLPHAINLNCFATSAGDLYLSCSNCDGKRWSGIAQDDGWARLRLDGAVYPVMPARPAPDARAGSGRARPGLERTTRQAELAGGARQSAGAARHPAAGPLVVVPRRVAQQLISSLAVPTVGPARPAPTRPGAAGPAWRTSCR